MFDYGTATHTCTMCGRERIRYVHVMVHHDAPTQHVGQQCAGHMADDYATARKRQAAMVGRSARLRRWIEGRWCQWPEGSCYRRTGGRIAKRSCSRFSRGLCSRVVARLFPKT